MPTNYYCGFRMTTYRVSFTTLGRKPQRRQCFTTEVHQVGNVVREHPLPPDPPPLALPLERLGGSILRLVSTYTHTFSLS